MITLFGSISKNDYLVSDLELSRETQFRVSCWGPATSLPDATSSWRCGASNTSWAPAFTHLEHACLLSPYRFSILSLF